MDYKEVIAIDFDGVIHSYINGYQEDGSLPDPPVDGAIDWLKTLINSDYEITIHSARLRENQNKNIIQDWLLDYGITPEELSKLKFEAKPIAILYIDDLAWQFTGKNFPTLEDVQKYKPWYEENNKNTVLNKLGKIIKKLGEISSDEEKIINNLVDSLFNGMYYQGVSLDEDTFLNVKKIILRALDRNIKQLESNRI